MQNKLFKYFVAPVEHVAIQIPRALVVSALAAALDVGVYALLLYQAHWLPVVAATVSYLLGGVVQYVLCSIWVFPSMPSNAAVGFVTFTLLSLVGLGITNGVIWVMHDQWHFNPMLAKIVALGLAFCWNFSSRKYLIFRGTTPDETLSPPPDVPVSERERV